MALGSGPVPEGGGSQQGGVISTLQNGVRAMYDLVTALGNIFPQTTGTSTTATGGSATLPANPVGFITVTIPSTGQSVKVPYYL